MQDFYDQQLNWLKRLRGSQETFMKQYADWGEQMIANIMKPFGAAPFQGKEWTQANIEAQYKEFGNLLNEMLGAWGGRIPAEAMKFMSLSYLEEFYKNWLTSLQPTAGAGFDTEGAWRQSSELLNSFLENSTGYLSSVTNDLTNQMNRAFGLLLGTLGREEGGLNDIIKWYEDFFNTFFESTTSQYTEKLTEVFDAWAAEVEKHLSAPKLGITRELANEVSQLMIVSKDYMQAYLKFWRLIEATSRKAGLRFHGRLREAALKNKPVMNFTDLCALWSIENETVFTEVMGTEEFAQLQGRFVDTGHRLKIQWDRLLEGSLEATPLALKRDLDLAIAEITSLRREVRNLRRELQEKPKEPATSKKNPEKAPQRREQPSVAVKKGKKAGAAKPETKQHEA